MPLTSSEALTLVWQTHQHHPRVKLMVQLLLEHQDEIEAVSSGNVQFHFSTFSVELLLPRPTIRRKV